MQYNSHCTPEILTDPALIMENTAGPCPCPCPVPVLSRILPVRALLRIPTGAANAGRDHAG